MKINRSKTGGRLIRAHIKVSGSSGGKIHITACLTHWFLQSHEPYLSCCCSLRPVCTQTSCRGKEHRWLSERKASILYRSHFFFFLWWIPRRAPCCCSVLQTEVWLFCFKLKLQVLFTSVFFFLYVSMRPDVNSSKNAVKCTTFQLSNFLFPFLDLPCSLPSCFLLSQQSREEYMKYRNGILQELRSNLQCSIKLYNGFQHSNIP